jgi:hypothetical protein
MMPSACYVRQAAGYLLVKSLTDAQCFSSNELENHGCAEKSDLDPQTGEEKLLHCLEDYFFIPARTMNRATVSYCRQGTDQRTRQVVLVMCPTIAFCRAVTWLNSRHLGHLLRPLEILTNAMSELCHFGRRAHGVGCPAEFGVHTRLSTCQIQQLNGG